MTESRCICHWQDLIGPLINDECPVHSDLTAPMTDTEPKAEERYSLQPSGVEGYGFVVDNRDGSRVFHDRLKEAERYRDGLNADARWGPTAEERRYVVVDTLEGGFVNPAGDPTGGGIAFAERMTVEEATRFDGPYQRFLAPEFEPVSTSPDVLEDDGRWWLVMDGDGCFVADIAEGSSSYLDEASRFTLAEARGFTYGLHNDGYRLVLAPETADKIARLKKENARLRAIMAAAGRDYLGTKHLFEKAINDTDQPAVIRDCFSRTLSEWQETGEWMAEFADMPTDSAVQDLADQINAAKSDNERLREALSKIVDDYGAMCALRGYKYKRIARAALTQKGDG